MKKTNIIVLVAVLLLVVGAIFVSANIEADEGEEPEELEASEVCGPGNCGGECGGSCGIPRCGCSR